MDVEKIARKALTILNLKYGLPKKGFITGGAIANLIWELVSGNKAVINDVDIFVYNPLDDNDKERIFKYREIETSYFEAYNHLAIDSNTKDSYVIKESIDKGIFNEIKYQSKNTSPEIVIKSFDINCTQIGYLIEDDKFYWTKEFEEFIETGELKITNLNTPAHTCIRIVKKKHELNATLNDFEIYLAKYVLENKHSFKDISRIRFMQRYADIFNNNRGYLGQFFELKRDEDTEKYLRTKEIIEPVYMLDPSSYIYLTDLQHPPIISPDFLFYMRNIYKTEKETTWKDLYSVYNHVNYIDRIPTKEEIEFLSKLVNCYPNIANQLKGLKFSEQIYVTKSILNKVTKYHDYNTAIAVLENVKFRVDSTFDDDECLLLGLSVRKKIKDLNTVSFEDILF